VLRRGHWKRLLGRTSLSCLSCLSYTTLCAKWRKVARKTGKMESPRMRTSLRHYWTKRRKCKMS
jgi:hypothetical protein